MLHGVCSIENMNLGSVDTTNKMFHRIYPERAIGQECRSRDLDYGKMCHRGLKDILAL